MESRTGAAAVGDRFEVDVPGSVDSKSGVIRFTTPALDVAPATLTVLASMDGGRTFSAPCPRRLTVRRRPLILSVSPGWASAAGGARVVVYGENMRPDPPSREVWIRFECGGVVKRARASPAKDSAPESFVDFDAGQMDGPNFLDFDSGTVPGEEGWACILPRMLECAGGAGPGGGLTANVTLSLDGGNKWLPMPATVNQTATKSNRTSRSGSEGSNKKSFLTMVLHMPLELQPPRPSRIWHGGGAELAIGGLGLFRTPFTAMRIVPVEGHATRPPPPSESTANESAPEKSPRACTPIPARLSSRPALVAITTALNFVGDAVVEVIVLVPNLGSTGPKPRSSLRLQSLPINCVFK
jgi:hypothetical protein